VTIKAAKAAAINERAVNPARANQSAAPCPLPS
jgi:hypothetical protein